MRGGFLTGVRKVEIHDIPVPEPGKGEVRIKIKQVGICGSDVSLFLGHRSHLDYPFIIGHEGIGHVDKAGEGVINLEVGDRVVIEPNYPCGTCEFCWQGRGNICPNKRIIGVLENGCFADYIIVPGQFAWKLPGSISDDNAVLVEPAAVALHTLFTSPARPGDTVAVLGLGAIGLLVMYAANKMGYKVIALDRVPEKIEFARRFGAITIPADANTSEIATCLREYGVHTVFECTGVAQAFSIAVEAAPRGAFIVVAGLSDKPANISEFAITRQGNQILTSLIYDHPKDFRRTIGLIESGFLQPAEIISKHINFTGLSDALNEAARGMHNKIIVDL